MNELTEPDVMREALTQAGQEQFQILMAEYMAEQQTAIMLMNGTLNMLIGMTQGIVKIINEREIVREVKRDTYASWLEQYEGGSKWYGERKPPSLASMTT